MIKIRELKLKDSKFMLEWMHDKNVIEFFSQDFLNKTFIDVKKFIKKSQMDKKNINYAIVDENDEYLGTASLKNIDLKNKNAEYAISIRTKAMGKDVSKTATNLVLKCAFKEMHLHKIYLCVAEDNKRAIKFYEKYGFKYEGIFTEHIYRNEKYINMLWFSILEDNFNGKL